MSEEDIDLDRVVTDPDYRRAVMEFLNKGSNVVTDTGNVEPFPVNAAS